MAAPAPEQALPHRSTTMSTDDDAVPGEDTSEVTRLFSERISAWRHAVAYLEDYIEATEKVHHGLGKDYEKVLKTVSHPLKEGTHFDQSLGGIAGMFDNIRSNTQGIANTHHETAKTIKGSVLPLFSRLISELKNKNKELSKGAGKGSKIVDKARNSTQKHIELLGQHTATFDSSGGKVDAQSDPYVLQRGVWHRLNKQVIEENNNRQDLLAVQNSFAQFEAHVIKTIQSGLGTFLQVVSAAEDHTKQMYGDLVGNAQRVPGDFEWNGFIKRNSTVLIDPNVPARSVQSITFPNQDHRATQPLIAGSLGKKGKILKKYEPYYYVVTPSKFLHEYKTDDDFSKEPVPENSLYLPDCIVGALDGDKFAIKGKDVSKGKLGNNFSMSHEYTLKAHTAADAVQWHDIIKSVAGGTSNEKPSSTPVSPTDAHHHHGAAQTTGIAAAVAAEEKHRHHEHESTPTSATSAPYSAAPSSATTAHSGAAPAYYEQPGSAVAPHSAAPVGSNDYAPQSTMSEPHQTVAGSSVPASEQYGSAAPAGAHTGAAPDQGLQQSGVAPATNAPPAATHAEAGGPAAAHPTAAPTGASAASSGPTAVGANPNLSSVGPMGSK